MEEKKQGTEKKKAAIFAITAVIAACILGSHGFAEILGFLLAISLGVLIYRAVKKKPKKNAAIAVAVCFAMVGIAGLFGGKGVPDNVLDYLGTKENVVYQTYDKDDFADYSGLKPYQGDAGTLPFILIERGEVSAVSLNGNSKKSFHMNGLHIGDSISHVTECMQKMNGIELRQNGNKIMYTCQYKGKKVSILIEINGDLIGELQASTSPGGEIRGK